MCSADYKTLQEIATRIINSIKATWDKVKEAILEFINQVVNYLLEKIDRRLYSIYKSTKSKRIKRKLKKRIISILLK